MWGPPILQEETAQGRPDQRAPSQNGSSTVCIHHTRGSCCRGADSCWRDRTQTISAILKGSDRTPRNEELGITAVGELLALRATGMANGSALEGSAWPKTLPKDGVGVAKAAKASRSSALASISSSSTRRR